jgi:hypothetical protein
MATPRRHRHRPHRPDQDNAGVEAALRAELQSRMDHMRAARARKRAIVLARGDSGCRPTWTDYPDDDRASGAASSDPVSFRLDHIL